MQELSLQHITNILWTFASFQHDVPGLLPALTEQTLQRTYLEQFNAQQLSNILWALSILKVSPQMCALPSCDVCISGIMRLACCSIHRTD